MKSARSLIPLGLLFFLALLPGFSFAVPGLLPGQINSPGSLHLLATCLLFAGLATSYDLLYGHTGLLSFGHALYVAIGAYTTNIAMSSFGWSFLAGVSVALGAGFVTAVLVGGLSLRVKGEIPFAMVTLAFAQAGAVFVLLDVADLTGGDEGITLPASGVPSIFIGVFNTVYVYWFCLAFLLVTFSCTRWAVNSSPGRVWAAIRENEQRVRTLGLSPYRYRLAAYVMGSSFATLGGVGYLLLFGGATPTVASAQFTLSLLVMVVLGGPGTRWGAVMGAIVYTLLDNQLLTLANSGAVDGMPAFIRVPLSQPLFSLGVLFILVVIFAPGGIVRVATRFTGSRGALGGRRLRRSSEAATAPGQASEVAEQAVPDDDTTEGRMVRGHEGGVNR